jgi:hypothetical protein
MVKMGLETDILTTPSAAAPISIYGIKMKDSILTLSTANF